MATPTKKTKSNYDSSAIARANKTMDTSKSVAKKLESVKTEEKKEPIKSRAKSKPYNDYLRFDLRPLGGKDYKSYIEEQARQESVKCGFNVSATRYLQALIDKDMETKGSVERTTKTELIDLIDKLGEEELKALQSVAKVLCK